MLTSRYQGPFCGFVDPIHVGLGLDQYRRNLVTINGLNADVDNAWEAIWTPGGAYAFPAAAGQMEVVSSSPNDDVGNTGITTVFINYLDANWDMQTTTVDLDGVNPVGTTPVNILRVNDFHAEACGGAGAAVGTIVLRPFGGGATYAQIEPGSTLAMQCIYSVPRNYFLAMYQWAYSAGAAVAGHRCDFRWVSTWDSVHSHINNFFVTAVRMSITDGSFQMEAKIPVTFGPQADIKIQAISDNGAANATVSSFARGWLEPLT